VDSNFERLNLELGTSPWYEVLSPTKRPGLRWLMAFCVLRAFFVWDGARNAVN
jgi:hypothetical protein